MLAKCLAFIRHPIDINDKLKTRRKLKTVIGQSTYVSLLEEIAKSGTTEIFLELTDIVSLR